MGEGLIFDIMHKDNIMTHVEYHFRTKFYKVINYDRSPLHCQLLDSTNAQDMFDWFETRCFPRTRVDKDIMLEILGLKQYMPLEIVKITHGVSLDNYIWIRFNEETLTWDDVNPRVHPAFWMK